MFEYCSILLSKLFASLLFLLLSLLFFVRFSFLIGLALLFLYVSSFGNTSFFSSLIFIVLHLFSSFMVFSISFSFSSSSYGIFLYLSVRNRLTLLFLTMVLYTLSIFTSSIFFTTITKSAKTGTSAVKFFNFGSILMGFVIVLPKTARMTKYFFGLIPQINIFLSLYTVFHYDNFDYISWDRLWVKAGRISYMESTLLFIFDIVFYLVTSIIIQSYKDSGLEFCDYIKSFIFRVSRKAGA